MRLHSFSLMLTPSIALLAAACQSGGGTAPEPDGAAADAMATTDAGKGDDATQTEDGASTQEASTEAAPPDAGPPTASPIKHVLVVIGENRTFDHVFATYTPTGGQMVSNLLSKGVIKADGTAGANYATFTQNSATTTAHYEISPGSKTPYTDLPWVYVGGPTTPFESTVMQAELDENGLTSDYYTYLTTGGTGLTAGTVDTRIPNVKMLPPGPYQLTPGIGYDDYHNSPVHRFYQMRQELDCSATSATADNPSGCLADLFPWVEVTIGTGNNGKTQPSGFDLGTTKEGAMAMGFYNMAQGDAPYLKSLADQYSLSDNFHQSILGGTGANHIALGTGDALWFSDGMGNAGVPPTLEIENPDPQTGTNNWYTQDGYSGGSYTDCSDATQPGVAAVTAYLTAMHVSPNCETGHYYLLNNYVPAFYGDGTMNTGQFVIPPSSTRSIADVLMEHGLSWRFYGDNWNAYLKDPEGFDPGNEYCNICNPFQYEASIMSDATLRTTNMKDTADLYTDIQNGYLPAFAIAKPGGLVDGHPASAKLDLFEGFAKKIIELVSANPTLFNETAIIVTFDEGGGFFDSGYVQPLDYFGDGTRIPAIVVSPHSSGKISHMYADHVSILKFVERNWMLPTISGRSRDNLPNPQSSAANPWVPTNGPAIGDLWDMFDFGQP